MRLTSFNSCAHSHKPTRKRRMHAHTTNKRTYTQHTYTPTHNISFSRSLLSVYLFLLAHGFINSFTHNILSHPISLSFSLLSTLSSSYPCTIKFSFLNHTTSMKLQVALKVKINQSCKSEFLCF